MERNKLQLTSNELKLIALVSMTVDHVGSFLLPQYKLLRIIGRLAFPIFAYMLAEGCRHTSSRLRYFCSIFGLAVLVQLFFWYTRHIIHQQILITFSMSLLLIFCGQEAEKRGSVWLLIGGVLLVFDAFICLLLKYLLPIRGFAVDYGLCGVVLPLLIYVGRTRTQRLAAAALGLTAVCIASSFAYQWFSLLAVPLLALYRGQRGDRRLKYLFYAYYPLHLLILESFRVTGGR